MPVFVDGYNLIHAAARAMDGFEIIAGETEPVRDRLVDLLGRYRTVKPDKITIFFDGGAEAGHQPRHGMERGIDLVFSDIKSDADTDIKNAVSRHDNPTSIRVVTSDMAIQRFVKRFGAKITESRDYLQEVQDALEDQALPQDEPIEKYEGPSSGDETEFWLNVFGEPSDED